MVNSVTVKAGSNTPKLNDPLVVRGWRADGILGMARTPEKAEKALGVKVAPNNDLYNANDFQKYNGAFPRVRARARARARARVRVRARARVRVRLRVRV